MGTEGVEINLKAICSKREFVVLEGEAAKYGKTVEHLLTEVVIAHIDRLT